jgi:hypothetical protein
VPALAETLISRFLEVQIVERSGDWNAIGSSDRSNSCSIGRIFTITPVGNDGRPPRSRPGRGAASSTSAAGAAKSPCRCCEYVANLVECEHKAKSLC